MHTNSARSASPTPDPGSLSPEGGFLLPVRVYYEDTDAAGIVYYANYLRFCERARTECLRALGVEQTRLAAETGRVFVVRSVQADYLAPAALDDQLVVRTTLERLRGASVVFRQRILRDERLLFEAAVGVACMDVTSRRAAPIPAALRTQLERLIEPT